jgi:hypothetical protein
LNFLSARVEGPKVPDEVVAAAKKLYRPNRKTGERRSLREIAAELSALRFNGPSRQRYFPGSIRAMLRR